MDYGSPHRLMEWTSRTSYLYLRHIASVKRCIYQRGIYHHVGLSLAPLCTLQQSVGSGTTRRRQPVFLSADSGLLPFNT